MSRLYLFASLAAGVALVLVGCNAATSTGSKNAPQPAATNAAQTKSTDASSPDAPAVHPVAAADEPAEGLTELPKDERAQAEQQKICPVTGEKLGTMGKPYKTTVKGQTVFLCCQGCEAALKKDPDKYLAKLNKNNKKDNKK